MSARPPVALFVFAHPPPGHHGHLRGLTVEVEQLRLHAEALRDRLGFEVRLEAETTPAHLLRLLTDRALADRVAVLHYAGHAEPDRWLLAGGGGAASAHAAGFVDLIRALPALRLVVLNGCCTAAQAEALAEGERAVVGTDTAIRDHAAATFSDWLYRGLTLGASVGAAFEQAVAAVRTDLGDDVSRLLSPADEDDDPPDGPPWRLVHATPEAVQWTLDRAVDDPLAGLPPLPRGRLPASPYRHVERFTKDHAEVFFGRGHDIRRLYERLTAPEAPPIVLLYGASGVGKSSLLEAGLGPRLAAGGRTLKVVRFAPDVGLLGGLRGCLDALCGAPRPAASSRAWGGATESSGARSESSESSGESLEPSGESLESSGESSESSRGLPESSAESFESPGASAASSEDASGSSDGMAWRAAEAAIGGPLILVLDQVEEALIAAEGSSAGLDALLRAVAGVFGGSVAPAGRLILAFRKGYVAEVDDALGRAGLSASRVFVKPLDRSAVVEVIEGPARRAYLREHFQLELEPGLAERIADEVTAGQPAAVAPILQILLTRMWGEAPERPVRFDDRRYDAIRREGVGLAQVFERQLAAAEAQIGGEGLLLDLLAFHTTERSTSASRDAHAVAARYAHADAHRAVQVAIGQRLLAEWGEGEGAPARGSRLGHDVWGPLVRGAFGHSERPGQRARRILENRVVDGDGVAPLDAHDLGRVIAGLPHMRARSAAEERLIERSRVAVAAEQRATRRRVWTRNTLFALVALFAGLLLVNRSELTRALADEAEARRIQRARTVEAQRSAREAREALARSRDATWMRMATERVEQPSIVAAALRNVGPARRDAVWLQAALDVLDRPIAHGWFALDAADDDEGRWDTLIGIDPQGRAVLRRGARVVRIDATGTRQESPLPEGWSDALLTLDRRGRIVGLVPDGPGSHRRRLRGLDDAPYDDVVDCAPRRDVVRAQPGSSRWLFAGSCGRSVWLMDQAGQVRRVAEADGGPARGHSVLVAADPERPRLLVCTATVEAGEWVDRLEWIDDVGGRAQSRRLGPRHDGCRASTRPWHEGRAFGAIADDGRQVAVVAGHRLHVGPTHADDLGARVYDVGLGRSLTSGYAPWLVAVPGGGWLAANDAGAAVVESSGGIPTIDLSAGPTFPFAGRWPRGGIGPLAAASAEWLAVRVPGGLGIWRAAHPQPAARVRLTDGVPIKRYWNAVEAVALEAPGGDRLYVVLNGGTVFGVRPAERRVVDGAALPFGVPLHAQAGSGGLAVVRGGAFDGATVDEPAIHWLAASQGDGRQPVEKYGLPAPVCAARRGLRDDTLITFTPDGAVGVWWLGGSTPVELAADLHGVDVIVAALAPGGPLEQRWSKFDLCPFAQTDWPWLALSADQLADWRRQHSAAAVRQAGFGDLVTAQLHRHGGSSRSGTQVTLAASGVVIRAAGRIPDHALAFGPDGRWLFGVDDAGVVYRWPAHADAAIEALADATTGCVPPDLRRTFFHLTDAEARAEWAACERARGREPLPRR